MNEPIHVFQDEDAPVAVGLIVDNSGSIRRQIEDVTAAALAFVRSSNQQDQLFVVDFNEQVWFGLPDINLLSAIARTSRKRSTGIRANGYNTHWR